ncbi:MAG: hypothetical protein KDI06_21965 [Calditrichaeota bacterium]|nr:hypothetical protein [Calditrichota bacterium]
MKGPVKIGLLMWILLSGFGALAQDSRSTIVQGIESSYEAFDYPETDRLLATALENPGDFPAGERLRIFRIAAFRSFQKNESLTAESYFWRLLEIDPTYNLSTVDTSPKLVALFNKVKIDYLKNLQSRSLALQEEVLARPRPWRSLILPGWEQWHRGYRLKGTMWAALTLSAVGGVLYNHLEAGYRREDYLAARDPQQARDLYDRYNRAYRNRYVWGYALAGVWLAAHLDAVFFSESPVAVELGTDRVSLRLGWGF